jgi:hypothetical protein
LFCKLLLKLVTTPFGGWWAAINGRSFGPKSSFCKKVNGIGRLAGFAFRINAAAIPNPGRRDAGAPGAIFKAEEGPLAPQPRRLFIMFPSTAT